MYSSTGSDAAAVAAGTPATERLYYTDAYRTTFLAGILAVVVAPGGRPGVVLDRTAFYPTSGGQPHDTGTLAGVPVVDVLDTGDHVVHLLAAGAAAPGIGTEVEGAIDWGRRFDHMQQHTAQHLVSAAFLRTLGAATVSVHLGDSSTMDFERAALSRDEALAVEDAVADAVYANRPVTIRFVDDAEAETLGLRRPAKRAGTLRVVEIEDLDRSACGGTHVRTTGEVGPVLLRRWERAKGHLRVEFLAGRRALRDYRWKHALVADWSGRLTVGDRELPDALGRLVSRAEECERALAASRRRLLAYEAAERLAAAPPATGPKILRLEFPQRDPEEVRLLLRELTAREPCVVLAGVVETGRLYFVRSPGAGADMAAVLRHAAQSVGGRGGGSAEAAQGTAPPAEVGRVLDLAASRVRDA
ncbi:MAG TPA: alanine--tRNA ligase-related protein [bacterium]|nr:alanine--tRNA ligase-related protein [bacterium]